MLAVEALVAVCHRSATVASKSKKPLNLPRNGKRRNNLVADSNRLHLVASLHHSPHELVAHDEARRRRLVAAEDVELTVTIPYQFHHNNLDRW